MSPSRVCWLATNLILVGLIALNGIFILTSMSRDMAVLVADAVQSRNLSCAFWAVRSRENLLGMLDLLMILIAIGLVKAKPSLKLVRCVRYE